ncbi:hypothetical protein J0A71_08g16750 [Encephalitozoon cuniculi]|nr:hypothetical protein J0A71_08g16750 [Encephalitozoon cuniculi]
MHEKMFQCGSSKGRRWQSMRKVL